MSFSLYALNEGNRDKTIRNLCSLQSTINLAVGVSHTAVRPEFRAFSLPDKFAGFYQAFWRTAAISLLDWVSLMSADTEGAAQFRLEMEKVTPDIVMSAWSFAIKNYRSPELLPASTFSYFEEDPKLAELKMMILSKFKPNDFSYNRTPLGAQLFYRQELKKIVDEANLWSDPEIKDAAQRFLLNEQGQNILEEYSSLTKSNAEPLDHKAIALKMLEG